MKIRTLQDKDIKQTAELVAKFRVELSSLKGINKEPNIDFAIEELKDYIDNKFPIFIAEDENKIIIGYLVCRVDGDVVWVESLYVLSQFRRKGAASMLYDEAEKLAKQYGNETLYNWVHPNNDKIINFLRKKGYNVLNLIEIRKPRAAENVTQKINVDKHEFDY